MPATWQQARSRAKLTCNSVKSTQVSATLRVESTYTMLRLGRENVSVCLLQDLRVKTTSHWETNIQVTVIFRATFVHSRPRPHHLRGVRTTTRRQRPFLELQD